MVLIVEPLIDKKVSFITHFNALDAVSVMTEEKELFRCWPPNNCSRWPDPHSFLQLLQLYSPLLIWSQMNSLQIKLWKYKSRNVLRNDLVARLPRRKSNFFESLIVTIGVWILNSIFQLINTILQSIDINTSVFCQKQIKRIVFASGFDRLINVVCYLRQRHRGKTNEQFYEWS